MNTNLRIGSIAIILCLAATIIIVFFSGFDPGREHWSLTSVAEAAKEGRIKQISVVSDTRLEVVLNDGKTIVSSKDPSGTALDQLKALGVSTEQLTRIEWQSNAAMNSPSLINTILFVIPPMMFFGLLIWVISRAKITRTLPSVGESTDGVTRNDN